MVKLSGFGWKARFILAVFGSRHKYRDGAGVLKVRAAALAGFRLAWA
jgi:hypothetical protein